MNLKYYIINVLVNFVIWILPLMIVTELLTGHMWIGGLVGILVIYMVGYNYLFRIENYKKPCKKE